MRSPAVIKVALVTLVAWASPALAAAATLSVLEAPVANAAAPAPTITAVAAGGYHSCALTSAGGVKCWGYNNSGQLGNGTTMNSFSPVDVVGLASGVTAIAAGYYHSCAVLSSGGAKCWGSNEYGQLGNGPRDGGPHPDSLTPVNVLRADSLSPVEIMSGVAAISAGGLDTCVLTSVGGVQCWGANDSGQLGYGKPTDFGIPWPVDVVELGSGVTAIATGPDHTCAVAGGQVKCWGNNGGGQLGDGSTTSTSTPVIVSGLDGTVTSLATGYDHTCALMSTGEVKCWGANAHGQLGDGTADPRFSPVGVLGLASGIRAIGAGAAAEHTCGLMNTGGVMCWGYNAYGQLGDGSASDRSAPVNVVGLVGDAEAVAVGYYHSCALTREGGVMCWGDNYAGGLGDGSTIDSNVPVSVGFTTQGLPQTDAADPAAHEVLADPRLLPLLAGSAAWIATLVRRRTNHEADLPTVSSAPTL
jgi:alpha-tubulin suppressor-like RCC1 family protein